MSTTAPEILEAARAAIADRAARRDQPDGERSMARTVDAFNAIHGTALTEVQGWQFMELLKMARAGTGTHDPDDDIDRAAYAALAGEAAARGAPHDDPTLRDLDLAQRHLEAADRLLGALPEDEAPAPSADDAVASAWDDMRTWNRHHPNGCRVRERRLVGGPQAGRAEPGAALIGEAAKVRVVFDDGTARWCRLAEIEPLPAPEQPA